MTSNYNKILDDVKELDNIQVWSDKIDKIKEIKDSINEEQKNLNNLLSSIMNNDTSNVESKKKKSRNRYDFDELIENFNNSELLDDKIKWYYLINNYISNVEKELFVDN